MTGFTQTNQDYGPSRMHECQPAGARDVVPSPSILGIEAGPRGALGTKTPLGSEPGVESLYSLRRARQAGFVTYK